MKAINGSEITPEALYHSRRQFMQLAGTAAIGTLLAACGSAATDGTTAAQSAAPAGTAAGGTARPTTVTAVDPPKPGTTGEPATPYDAITNYNNYYEFTTEKEGVAALARSFTTTPWTVQVGGLVAKPKTYAVEDLMKRFAPEERIYRHRCVEGWSMVIPWQGFALRKLLAEVEPTAQAKYVRFTTVSRPAEMPGQKDSFYPWPYTEGLRLDEAMNDLALLVTGLYGKPVPPQNGAPIRLAVPWKYGFKSAKAIVKIDLVDQQFTTLWMASSPGEYGFYANVNPNVPHPRWSQSSERRIGETGRRKTLLFNGYADEVAHLYDGMDLRKNF